VGDIDEMSEPKFVFLCVDEPGDMEDGEDKENEMPVDAKEKKRKRVKCHSLAL